MLREFNEGTNTGKVGEWFVHIECWFGPSVGAADGDGAEEVSPSVK